MILQYVLKWLINYILKVYYIYRNRDAPLVFEYDETKSRVNLAKHGIDFVKAQELWSDENLIAKNLESITEPRSKRIGMISGKIYCAFITMRGEKIRIISVRRARKDEVIEYERNNR